MSHKPSAQVRVAIYSRVSTDHQTTENQERRALPRLALFVEPVERAGIEPDRARSSARPALASAS